MFEREMMIAGLQRQRNLLTNLIQELENRPALDLHTWSAYDARTKLVANNLRKLRKIKSGYAVHRQSEFTNS